MISSKKITKKIQGNYKKSLNSKKIGIKARPKNINNRYHNTKHKSLILKE